MATISPPQPLTAEQYAQLDEVAGFRSELIEGERVLSPSPKFAHGQVIRNLQRILERQLATIAEAQDVAGTTLRVECEQGWFFQTAKTESILEPDLMVIREEEATQALGADTWFQGVPLFVVEVVSPSERKSKRLQKIGMYLEVGVPYVIEVDYKRLTVLVYTPDADAPKAYNSTERLASPFEARVQEIFLTLP